MNDDEFVEGSTDLPDLSEMSLHELGKTTNPVVLGAVEERQRQADEPPAEVDERPRD